MMTGWMFCGVALRMIIVEVVSKEYVEKDGQVEICAPGGLNGPRLPASGLHATIYPRQSSSSSTSELKKMGF